MVTLQKLQTQCNEGSRRSEVVASRVDEVSGEAASIRGRLEGLERRVGIESQQHESVLRELRASHDQHATDLSALCHNANKYQADIQARDNETFELKELIFKLSVEVDDLREDAKKNRAMPEKGFVETSDYQEQMNVLQRNLDESRRQLEAQEQKIREGERRLSRLQEEVSVNQLRPKPERHEGLPDDIRAAIEDRFAKIEEKLQRNQQQSSRWQEDSVRDFQAVEAYLTRVHTMVTEMQQTEGSSSAPSRGYQLRPEGRSSSRGGIARCLPGWRSGASRRTGSKDGCR